ncbi:GbsR/MarR family transcriptional regulator [Nonomuraea diastatica]|uniref:MarR family transcriptional regulator n=1 Tax=Nonomuraea diastatica TaxID=1848329 RepID=A0A4R4W3P6_9ACTN|nr:MarR family transcriptional regulator [Nonomuraea diastatica]
MGVDQFVEDAGLFYARLGLSRTAGRVMGWLLTAESGSADAPELAEGLAVAKSSMSIALRQLEQAGLVERFRVRGGTATGWPRTSSPALSAPRWPSSGASGRWPSRV